MMYRSILLLLLLFTAANANGATHTVCLACTVKTITEAVMAAQPCDTVLVLAGTYREETLVIDKPLYLIGKNFPVLDGQEKIELISIISDEVVVNGFEIINAAFSSSRELAGINIMNADFVQIINNRIRNTCFGVYLANANHCRVQNNTLQTISDIELSAGNGIHAWKCSNLQISGNNISGHRDGIYFEFVTHSVISNNHSYRNMRYGLHFMFSHQNKYNDNIFEDNGAGVVVMYTKEVTMLNNQFLHNRGDASYGLLLKDISDSHIEGNLFKENTIAIQMEGCSRIQIVSNGFSFNGWAIQLQASCDNNVFTNNNFSGNTFDIATNGSLVLNQIDRNYWDKYEGYDLNKDGIGDVPYRPVSLYSMLVAEMPFTIMLWRSFVVYLIDRIEKLIPSLTPENLMDNYPLMKQAQNDKSTRTQ